MAFQATAYSGGQECLLTHLFAQELGDQRNGRVRVFFHDPVAGVWHDPTCDIYGNKAQVVRHPRAKGLLGAQGEHRHLQLAPFGQQVLVVDRVLSECSELLEGIVHGVRTRVESGVVLAGLFVDRLRIS